MAQQGKNESDGCWIWVILLLVAGGIIWWFWPDHDGRSPKPTPSPPPPTHTPAPPPTHTPVPPPTHTPESTWGWLPEGLEIHDPSSDSDSHIVLKEGTDYSPPFTADECDGDVSRCPYMEVWGPDEFGERLKDDSLPALPDPYEKEDVIAAVQIRPGGRTYEPPLEIHYEIPSDYQEMWQGRWLPVLRLDENEEDSEWQDAGLAEVCGGWAVYSLEHTTICALMKPKPCMPITSLFNDLDSAMPSSEYAAMGVYFAFYRAEEVVEAIQMYVEERGLDLEITWAEIPPDVELSETDYLEGLAWTGGYGPTVLLLIDLPESTNELLVAGAETIAQEVESYSYDVIQVDTCADEVTLLAVIE